VTAAPIPDPRACALALDRVGRNFGALAAVHAVSIQVRTGSTHVIIGPNGAGKTTLFALISGELPLSDGSIHLFGADVSRWSATRRSLAGIGRTYQITNVLAGLTVEQNLLLALRGKDPIKFSLFGNARPRPEEDARIEELLTRCGIHAFRRVRPANMAYGQQRQLELAIALANAPKVLLLDEPAAGLSPAERGPMADIIEQLPDALTVLLIEHDMALALRLADRVTCLHYGEVLAEGSADDIRGNDAVQAVYFGTAAHA